MKWDCAGLALNSFPDAGSWIKHGISLDYSLWWPLGVLSSGYLKHSASTLGPAQRKLQGFGHFEMFQALLEHLSLTGRHGKLAESRWRRRWYFAVRDLFPDGSCWSHYGLISSHGLLVVKPPNSCCPSQDIYLLLWWAGGSVILGPWMDWQAVQGCAAHHAVMAAVGKGCVKTQNVFFKMFLTSFQRLVFVS